MFWIQIVFWLSLALIFYSYFGYGLHLWLLRLLWPGARKYSTPPPCSDEDCPEVALLIAAWNEEAFLPEKLGNTNELDYPDGKLTVYIITDGSTDASAAIARTFPIRQGLKLEVHHKDGRSGKQAAIDRVLPMVTAPIVVFSDANTYLNKEAIRNIVRHYQDPEVAGVAGEKRIMRREADVAAGAGEGLYWRFESMLKRWDAEFYSVVGAAGELFSVRRHLIPHVPQGILVEDFYTTMQLCSAGYRVAYAPDAYAEETSSANIAEEMKRKVRIAAGGLQAAGHLTHLLNPLPNWRLSFQYVGHRLLRWTIGPMLIPVVLIINIWLAMSLGGFYTWLLVAQVAFYLFALLGWIFEQRQMKFKLFFVPMYFTMMNIAVYRGIARLIGKRQTVIWEKAERAPVTR